MKNLKILDNFLTNEHFSKLSSLDLQQVKNNEIKVYHNKIYNDGVSIPTCLEKNFLVELQNTYHSKAIDILKNLSKEKANLYQYSEFHVVKTGKDYFFPIHRDTPNKLLSGVIYLTPSKNEGTYLYSDRYGKNPNQIEWKQNRAVFFSRTENDSWHNYRSDGKNSRLVLIYNLMTNDIRSVCKIDNVSYYKVFLREKINKYLLKFFNFMI